MQESTSTASAVEQPSRIAGVRQMEPRFGFEVFKIAVKLFERHPLPIFLFGFAFMIFLALNQVAPLPIHLLMAFVSPVISIGLLRCFRVLDSTTEKVRMSHLGEIFFDRTRKEDYLILGAVNVGYAALLLLLTYTGSVPVVFQVAIAAIYGAATFFAYPLVEFDRVKPVEAMKQSLQITHLNWKPALVYFFASLIFCVLSLCALGVGFFIYFPLQLLTRYVAYRIVLSK